MKTKKEILKSCCTGKGGPGILDVAKEIPGTLKGMGQNLMKGNIRKAVDPANLGGKVKNALGKGVSWMMDQSAKDNSSRAASGIKLQQENQDNLHGGRYTPSTTTKDIMQKAVKNATTPITKMPNTMANPTKKTGIGTRYPNMAPLKTSMPLKDVKTSIPLRK